MLLYIYIYKIQVQTKWRPRGPDSHAFKLLLTQLARGNALYPRINSQSISTGCLLMRNMLSISTLHFVLSLEQ